MRDGHFHTSHPLISCTKKTPDTSLAVFFVGNPPTGCVDREWNSIGRRCLLKESYIRDLSVYLNIVEISGKKEEQFA